MIKYSKRANVTLFFIYIPIGILFTIFHYFEFGFSYHIIGILGIGLILGGVYLLLKNKGKLLFGKLLIDKDNVEVDGQRIPASAIREIVPEEKGWKITIKTWLAKDAVIYLGDYLVFSNKEKLKKIYKQLVALQKKNQLQTSITKTSRKNIKSTKKRSRRRM